jgi:hypothetical protein
MAGVGPVERCRSSENIAACNLLWNLALELPRQKPSSAWICRYAARTAALP